MGNKSSLKRTYCNKRSDNSTQLGNKVLSISLIRNFKYWNLSIHSNQLYVLLNMCHAKNKLKKINEIINNLSEN